MSLKFHTQFKGAGTRAFQPERRSLIFLTQFWELEMFVSWQTH